MNFTFPLGVLITSFCTIGCTSNGKFTTSQSQATVLSSKATDEMRKYLEFVGGPEVSRGEDSINNVIQERDFSYQHRRLTIWDSVFYLVEGDILLDSLSYINYRLTQIILRESFDSTNKGNALRGEKRNGLILKWPDSPIVFTILKRTFPVPGEFELLKSSILQATKDWEATCHVRFQYDESAENILVLSPPEGLSFVVIGVPFIDDFVASAFFPEDAPDKRRLVVAKSYFTTAYNRVGVFRHEIGHILGFRHGHNHPDAPSACPKEIVAGEFDINRYNPVSVMHYFCGGVGSRELRITDEDASGAREIYGPPTH